MKTNTHTHTNKLYQKHEKKKERESMRHEKDLLRMTLVC